VEKEAIKIAYRDKKKYQSIWDIRKTMRKRGEYKEALPSLTGFPNSTPKIRLTK
jgi:hypothetical protein